MHKFCRNTATPIHWCITTFSLWRWSWVVETEQVAKLNDLLSGPWQKRFADPSSRLYTHTYTILVSLLTMCSRLSTKISSFHADTSMMQSWVINITLTLPDDSSESLCKLILHNLRDDAVASTAQPGHILASRQVDLSALSSGISPVALALGWVSRCVETATVLTAPAWGLSG